ncbi:heterokaryon incompatibility protein-domain-containing protein [Paraphoma chrysanthemicola]|nr:heterokaryon incompatibility protein-domain-containing protein [Paraphoma chrysanthemicola]
MAVDQRRQGTRGLSADGLCDLCSTVPWDGLLSCEPGSPKSCIPIQPELEGDNPTCRICRFFAKFEWEDGLLNLRVGSNVYSQKLQVFSFDHRHYCAGRDVEGAALKRSWIISKQSPEDPDVAAGLQRIFSLPAIDYERTRNRLAYCDQHHGVACKTGSIASLKALRVIDCHSRKIVSAPKDCRFVALSYVWGRVPFVPKGRSTVLQNLPQTIEDAITMTISLGYDYLWVDRYCIDQGDAEDVNRQVSQMGKLYSAAAVTLFASSGSDPTYGLPGLRPNTRKYTYRYEAAGNNYLIALPGHSTMDIYRSNWFQRAWTFQEGFMSKKRLFFTDREMLFVCNRTILNESEHWDSEHGSQTRLRGAFPNVNGAEEADGMELALRLIDVFSPRKLTHQSDALKAICGALETLPLSRGYPVFHLSAVPFTRAAHESLPSISLALHWMHTGPCRRRTDFPSWSPLGWDGWVHGIAPQTPVVPADCSLALRRPQESIDLTLLTDLTNGLYDSEKLQPTRILEITAYMVSIPLHFGTPLDLPESGPSVRTVLPLDAARDLSIRVPVDSMDYTHAEDTGPALGLILRSGEALRTARSSGSDIVVMLLKFQGNHYERAALFQVPTENYHRLYCELVVRSHPHPLETGDLDFVKESFLWLRHAKKQCILLG